MTARVFQSGNSQAIRIPKELRLDVDEMEIERDGDVLRITPIKNKKWDRFFQLLDTIEEEIKDFLTDRNDEVPEPNNTRLFAQR